MCNTIDWYLPKLAIRNEKLSSFIILVSETLSLTNIFLSSLTIRQTIRYPIIIPLGSDGDAQVRRSSVGEMADRLMLLGTPGAMQWEKHNTYLFVYFFKGGNVLGVSKRNPMNNIVKECKAPHNTFSKKYLFHLPQYLLLW